jgi:hypothetical protein
LLTAMAKQDAEGTEITPVQYDPAFPFKYNNFVYRLLLPAGTPDCLGSEGYKLEHLPGCVPIPAGTKEFILRLSNPDAEGMHHETRVQNEVAILSLASAALRHVQPAVVPRVFGWGAAGSDRTGWILQELMPGMPLAEEFSKSMSLNQKRGILAQMANLLQALQDYQLPESIKGWGGLTFDDAGAIVSAPMPTVGAGPWSSLEDSYKDRLTVALARADANPHLQGWRVNGVRKRVDAFIEHGLPAHFAHLTSQQDRVIVHGDFGKYKMLVLNNLLLKRRRSSRESALRPVNRPYHSTPRLRFRHHPASWIRVSPLLQHQWWLISRLVRWDKPRGAGS